MTSRIVVFGATGYTGRLVAERLAAQGARPVLAGRDERRLGELAERLGGLETVKADAMRRNSVFAAVEPGDVLVSTVGPFAKWGDAAVRAAIAAAGAVYLDSTGEPVFIRRVFEELGGPAERAGVDADDRRWASTSCPGALAGALALREAGRERGARRRRLLLARRRAPTAPAPGTRESLVGATLNDNHAFRDGRGAHRAPGRARARRSPSRARSAAAISVGGAEHFTLPPVHPALLEVNVYLGWFGAAGQAAAGRHAGRAPSRSSCPGVRSVLQAAGERLVSLAGAPEAGHDARTRCPGSPPSPTTRPASRSPRSTSPAPTPTTSPPPSWPGPRSAPPAATARTRSAPSGRSRRSASTRSSRAAPRRATLRDGACAGAQRRRASTAARTRRRRATAASPHDVRHARRTAHLRAALSARAAAAAADAEQPARDGPVGRSSPSA